MLPCVDTILPLKKRELRIDFFFLKEHSNPLYSFYTVHYLTFPFTAAVRQ